jgi:hypothetical protein
MLVACRFGSVLVLVFKSIFGAKWARDRKLRKLLSDDLGGQ